MSGPVKRFIAGAVCPAYQTVDTMKMWNEDGVPHRECASCGYGDTLDERGNSVPKELPTRVNAPNQPKPATAQVKVAQFFPNPKLKKDKPD